MNFTEVLLIFLIQPWDLQEYCFFIGWSCELKDIMMHVFAAYKEGFACSYDPIVEALLLEL